MTLYELLKDICSVIRPESGDLYNYMLHTFDDNGGFLRTRYCYWQEPLKDKEVRKSYKSVLVAAESPIETRTVEIEATLKMQLDYSLTEAGFEDAEYEVELGYNYVYVIDLGAKTYNRRFMESDQFYSMSGTSL